MTRYILVLFIAMCFVGCSKYSCHKVAKVLQKSNVPHEGSIIYQIMLENKEIVLINSRFDLKKGMPVYKHNMAGFWASDLTGVCASD